MLLIKIFFFYFKIIQGAEGLQRSSPCQRNDTLCWPLIYVLLNACDGAAKTCFHFCPHPSAPGLNHHLRSGVNSEASGRAMAGAAECEQPKPREAEQSTSRSNAGGGTYQISGCRASRTANGPEASVSAALQDHGGLCSGRPSKAKPREPGRNPQPGRRTSGHLRRGRWGSHGSHGPPPFPTFLHRHLLPVLVRWLRWRGNEFGCGDCLFPLNQWLPHRSGQSSHQV